MGPTLLELVLFILWYMCYDFKWFVHVILITANYVFWLVCSKVVGIFDSFYLFVHVALNHRLNTEQVFALRSSEFLLWRFLFFIIISVDLWKSFLRRQRMAKMTFFFVISRKTVKYTKGCTLNTGDQRAKTFTATLSRKWSCTELFSLNSSWAAGSWYSSSHITQVLKLKMN